MTVWKFIYIKFYEFRRWLLGRTLGEEYAAMLFVASFDCLLFWGSFLLLDKLIGNWFLMKNRPFFFLIFMGGMLTIERLRNRSLCKKGAFDRIKKQVEEEPNKKYWGLLSILYMLLAVAFFGFSCYSTIGLDKL